MKQAVILALAMQLACAFAGGSVCALAADSTGTNRAESGMKGKKVLVAVFSRAGENYGVGNIATGNTRIVAEMIAEATGGGLFVIEPVRPYPAEYKQCTEVAKEEQQANARPALKARVENPAQYDVVFLGYPNWWGDMPMPVYTFLEQHGLAGKTILPFCTHEGSGLSATDRKIAALLPHSTVKPGLAVQGRVAQKNRDRARDAVREWLAENGF